MNQNLSKLIEVATGYRDNPVFNAWRASLKGRGLFTALIPFRLGLLALLYMGLTGPGSPFHQPVILTLTGVVFLFGVWRCLMLMSTCRQKDGRFVGYDSPLVFSEQYWGRMLPLVLEVGAFVVLLSAWWNVLAATSGLSQSAGELAMSSSYLSVTPFCGLLFSAALTIGVPRAGGRAFAFIVYLAIYLVTLYVIPFLLFFQMLGPFTPLLTLWLLSGPLIVTIAAGPPRTGLLRGFCWLVALGLILGIRPASGTSAAEESTAASAVVTLEPEIELVDVDLRLCGPAPGGGLLCITEEGLSILDSELKERLAIPNPTSDRGEARYYSAAYTREGNIFVKNTGGRALLDSEGNLIEHVRNVRHVDSSQLEDFRALIGPDGMEYRVDWMKPENGFQHGRTWLIGKSLADSELRFKKQIVFTELSGTQLASDYSSDGVYLFDGGGRKVLYYDARGEMGMKLFLPKEIRSGNMSGWPEMAVDSAGNLIFVSPPQKSHRPDAPVPNAGFMPVTVVPRRSKVLRSYLLACREGSSPNGVCISEDRLYVATVHSVGSEYRRDIVGVALEDLGLSSN